MKIITLCVIDVLFMGGALELCPLGGSPIAASTCIPRPDAQQTSAVVPIEEQVCSSMTPVEEPLVRTAVEQAREVPGEVRDEVDDTEARIQSILQEFDFRAPLLIDNSLDPGFITGAEFTTGGGRWPDREPYVFIDFDRDAVDVAARAALSDSCRARGIVFADVITAKVRLTLAFGQARFEVVSVTIGPGEMR